MNELDLSGQDEDDGHEERPKHREGRDVSPRHVFCATCHPRRRPRWAWPDEGHGEASEQRTTEHSSQGSKKER